MVNTRRWRSLPVRFQIQVRIPFWARGPPWSVISSTFFALPLENNFINNIILNCFYAMLLYSIFFDLIRCFISKVYGEHLYMHFITSQIYILRPSWLWAPLRRVILSTLLTFCMETAVTDSVLLIQFWFDTQSFILVAIQSSTKYDLQTKSYNIMVSYNTSNVTSSCHAWRTCICFDICIIILFSSFYSESYSLGT